MKHEGAAKRQRAIAYAHFYQVYVAAIPVFEALVLVILGALIQHAFITC